MNRHPAIYILFIFLCSAGLLSYGRGSVKLYSRADNLVWDHTEAWSLTPGGSSCGMTPQANDSLIISHSVILISDFQMDESGCVLITSRGVLKGDAGSLLSKGNSSVVIEGNARLYSATFAEHSSFLVSASGRFEVLNSLSNMSGVSSFVHGKLFCYGSVNASGSEGNIPEIAGTGIVSASHFSGNGSLMSFGPLSGIPDFSVLAGNTWTGSYNQDWDDSRNWTSQEVPASTDKVAILYSPNAPHLSGTGYCHDLILSPGSALHLEAGSAFLISGNLEIPSDASLNLDNITGIPAALVVTGTISGRINSAFQVEPNKHQLVSSPVADALSGVFINMYLREFDETTSNWGNYIVPTDLPLNKFKGYELSSPYGSTRVFSGVPNTGTIEQEVTMHNEGLNLLGNPYPCYLDWGHNSGVSNSSVAEAIYYPDPMGSGNYSAYIPGDEEVSINGGSRFIPPMQGFFVKARQDGKVAVNMDAASLTGGAQVSRIFPDALKFTLENTTFRDETLIRFNEDASYSYDDAYDAIKLSNLNPVISVFTKDQDNTPMAVNTLPSISSSLTIPVAVTCSAAENLKLTITGSADFEFRYPLTLEDRINHIFIDLRSDSTYTFQHSPEMETDRFILHFDVLNSTNEQVKNDPEVVFSNGYIRVNGIPDNTTAVDVIGLDGRKVYTTSGKPSSEIQIPFSDHGVFLVRITTKTTCYAHKICTK